MRFYRALYGISVILNLRFYNHRMLFYKEIHLEFAIFEEFLKIQNNLIYFFFYLYIPLYISLNFFTCIRNDDADDAKIFNSLII